MPAIFNLMLIAAGRTGGPLTTPGMFFQQRGEFSRRSKVDAWIS
jgi:hypothetical protein